MIRCSGKWLAAVLASIAVGTATGSVDTARAASQRMQAPSMVTTAPHDYRDRNFDYFVAGNPALPRATRTSPGLALMGGGGSVDAAFAFIAAHAGHGRIVILAAVGDDQFDPDDGRYGNRFLREWGPVGSAETIVFHNRDAAHDARVIAALRGADGIFLAGGDQANYIRYWKGTPVQDALNAHIRAGRPIGGSSAGLAILGHYSYTALDGGSMESKIALADPHDAGITLEDDFLHARWLDHVITDTHFSQRHRLGRLIAFVARVNHDREHANVFGIGVDEHSALLIDANGIGRLADGSHGSVWLVLPTQPARVMPAGQPLSIADIHLLRVDTQSRVNLARRDVQHPAAEATISIVQGMLANESIASPILERDVAPPGEG